MYNIEIIFIECSNYCYHQHFILSIYSDCQYSSKQFDIIQPWIRQKEIRYYVEVLLWWLISRSKKPTQNLKKFLEIWNLSQISLQTCVLILVEEFIGFCPCWWEDMEKLMELSRKSYLEAWNPSLFIKFVIINTSDGFF